MNIGAIIMLIFGVLFLYGGILYFVNIAVKSKEGNRKTGQAE